MHMHVSAWSSLDVCSKIVISPFPYEITSMLTPLRLLTPLLGIVSPARGLPFRSPKQGLYGKLSRGASSNSSSSVNTVV